MLPRAILLTGYLMTAFGLGLFDIPYYNIALRAVFVAAAIGFIIIRGARPFVLGCMMVTIVYIIIIAFFTPYPEFTWEPVIFGLNQVLTVYLFMSVRYNSEDAARIFAIASWMPLLMFVVGFVYTLARFHPLFSQTMTGIVRLQGTSIPAFYAGIAMCGTFAATKMAVHRPQARYVGLVLINLMILLATGARMPAAVAIPLCIILFATSRQLPAKVKLGFPVFGAVIAGGPLALAAGSLFSRLETGGTSGRDVMWDYIELLAHDYWWTGVGFMQILYMEFPHEVAVQVNGITAVHNDFIRLYAEIGMPGMILFYSILSIAYLYAANKSGGWRNLPISTLTYIGFLAFSWTDNAFGTNEYYMLLVLGLLNLESTVPAQRQPEQAVRFRHSWLTQRAFAQRYPINR